MKDSMIMMLPVMFPMLKEKGMPELAIYETFARIDSRSKKVLIKSLFEAEDIKKSWVLFSPLPDDRPQRLAECERKFCKETLIIFMDELTKGLRPYRKTESLAPDFSLDNDIMECYKNMKKWTQVFWLEQYGRDG